MGEWISVKDRLPPVNEYGESDYLLCCYANDHSWSFVGWYNADKGWTIAHHQADYEYGVPVSHWQELPVHPAQVEVMLK